MASTTNFEKEKERALKGFPPAASQIYLEKQPNLSLFCKPLLIPLKSPNLLMLEKMEQVAIAKEITVPNVMNDK